MPFEVAFYSVWNGFSFKCMGITWIWGKYKYADDVSLLRLHWRQAAGADPENLSKQPPPSKQVSHTLA